MSLDLGFEEDLKGIAMIVVKSNVPVAVSLHTLQTLPSHAAGDLFNFPFAGRTVK